MSTRPDPSRIRPSGPPLLSVEGIETFYGGIQALKGVSLAVPEGSIVTLLGANGAGKSTTLKSISGLVPPARGTVTFSGRRIDGLPSEKIVRLGISHVPEGRELFPELTVLENLKMGAYTRTDRRAVGRGLERVQAHFPILAERRLQLAGTLSGGEQQMLAVGRALMARPRLLMLDEPTTGLAPIIAQSAFEALEGLKTGGMTLLIAEQQVPLALSVADRGYVLENGRIRLTGTSEELDRNPEVQRAYLGVA